MKTESILGCLCQAACVVAFPSVVLSADDWWFEVGPVVRGDMKVSVSGSSYTQQLGRHDPMATGPLALPAGAGPSSGYADRSYNNGYVKQDPGTGNPNSLDPNTTWNWGFNNSSQVIGQTLNFQAVGAPGYTTLQNKGASGSDDMLGAGFQAVIGRKLMESDQWSLDGCLVFQATWAQDDRLNTSTYGEVVQKITVNDAYDISRIGAANLPAPGFQGTYLGPFGTPPVVPSPVIPGQPESRSQTTSAALSTSYNRIGFDVKQALYEIGLGPQIGCQVTQRLKLHLRPTISLNLIDADVHRTEMFAGQTWSDNGSKFDVRFGMGINGGASLDLGHGFYLGISGGYDYVPQHLDVSVGPNTISLDPSGWEVSGVIGVRF